MRILRSLIAATTKHAVIFAFLAELPGSEDAVGEVFDRIAIERRDGEDDDLVAGCVFLVFEERFELRFLLRREDVGVIVHAAFELGDGGRGGSGASAARTAACAEAAGAAGWPTKSAHGVLAARQSNFTCGTFSASGGLFEVFGRVEAAAGGDEAGEEAVHQRVVRLHLFVVAFAGHVDAVFGAFQLRLQVEKVLVGFEIGIVARPRRSGARVRRPSSFGLAAVLASRRGYWCGGFDFDLAHFRAGFGHFVEHFFFVRGVAFDRGHEIGNQIAARCSVESTLAQALCTAWLPEFNLP